ncbi:PREDICTED: F-box/LRR-repeat protein 7-like [Ceratosolen solmsi marchali]|uniref:F-box/LRR-repeat protein 7-like n=1 Tax=Ceratosolen solmsi marchali TaxID=326594 RepID=A0AAJ6YUK8_9HYME|nr:PREDICTED: F-box/LRR-repeat protein 7-like [Ceratosolen solmsi marchali]
MGEEWYKKQLYKLWSYNISDSLDNIKPFTVDGVPIRKLFIGNLAQRTTHKDLEKLFSVYGKLDSCFLKRNTCKYNYAFVTFKSTHEALEARKDGLKKKIHLHNRDLRVMPADSWHQPDSIENQNKKVQKASESMQKISTTYILNDDAEIHKLNNDCLMHVFMFLPIIDKIKMERVCRRWRIISQESWRTFKKLDLSQSSWGFDILNNGPREVYTATLRQVLLRCGQFLSHIDLSKFTENLSQSTLTIVARLCPNLQHINITGLAVSSAGIKTLTDNCHNITEFSLGLCSASCDNDLSDLFLKNEKLRYLKLTGNSISGRCLLNLPVESIEIIILDDCNNISPEYFHTAIQRLQKLHTLSVKKCITFADQTVKAISLCSKSLKVLCLCHYYPMIVRNAMLCIAELVNLETLNLNHNISVGDEFLVGVGAQCKQLKNVDISCCKAVTNKGLAAIISLPNLQHLSINYLFLVTDEVLTEMVNLRTMHCQNCFGFKNTGLCRLIEESHQLELLDFSGCTCIDNELVDIAIKATRNRTNNTILKMYVGNTSINVSEITKVSPFLQVLNVDLTKSEHLNW